MLIYKRTSLLESTAQTLVNTVNCVGVMGKGIAKEFKQREPKMFAAYKKLCDVNALTPGKLWLWRGSPNWILNFPTKVHWRNPSRMEWIEAGLDKFVQSYAEQGITEISFPKLGCGNGNLDWNEVRPLMESYLSGVSIPVYIHDFTQDMGLPEHLEQIAKQVNKSVGSDLSFQGFQQALEFITRVSPKITLESGDAFDADFRNGSLSIKTSKGELSFEEDDLRGVWISLINGLVTKEKAGWTDTEAAVPLLTMMRLIPFVRGVNIQKAGSDEPELAVELSPEASMSFETLSAKPQRELPWH